MSGRVDHAMSTSSSEELKEADRLERGIVGGEAEDHVNAQHAVLIVDEDEMKSTRRNENTEITVKVRARSILSSCTPEAYRLNFNFYSFLS